MMIRRSYPPSSKENTPPQQRPFSSSKGTILLLKDSRGSSDSTFSCRDSEGSTGSFTSEREIHEQFLLLPGAHGKCVRFGNVSIRLIVGTDEYNTTMESVDDFEIRKSALAIERLIGARKLAEYQQIASSTRRHKQRPEDKDSASRKTLHPIQSRPAIEDPRHSTDHRREHSRGSRESRSAVENPLHSTDHRRDHSRGSRESRSRRQRSPSPPRRVARSSSFLLEAAASLQCILQLESHSSRPTKPSSSSRLKREHKKEAHGLASSHSSSRIVSRRSKGHLDDSECATSSRFPPTKSSLHPRRAPQKKAAVTRQTVSYKQMDEQPDNRLILLHI